MVRAFSSLCGSLFLLWQHYQTCKALWIFLFHMACISSTQTHSLSFSIRIHTTHQSKPSTQSATARRLCLWLQPWLFSAGSGELSEHPSIHPSISNPSPDVLHPSNTFKQIGMPWKSPKEGVQYGPRCPDRLSWLLSNTEKQQFCSELPSDVRAPHLSLRLC